jgi:hypothetical protein
VTWRVVKQMRGQTISRAWRCWNEQHSRLVQQRQITQRIVYHWRSCHVAEAFSSWLDKTAVMKRLRSRSFLC